MNNRQKAKKFKRLYEELLKIPYPVSYVYKTSLQHYKAEWMVRREDFYELTQTGMIDKVAAASLLKKLEPLVKDNMYSYKDDKADAIRYCIDLWSEQGTFWQTEENYESEINNE